MDNQPMPTTQPQTELPPQPAMPSASSVPPQQPPKGRKVWWMACLLLVVLLAIGAFLVFHKTSPSKSSADKGTHSQVYASDLRYGDNRAVNACNVLPISLVSSLVGANNMGDNTGVQESFIESDVPNSIIDPTGGNNDVSDCQRNLASGGVVTLQFNGYRNFETAKAGYDRLVAHSTQSSRVTKQSIAGLEAVTEQYRPGVITVQGVHNNFVYTLEFESPLVDGTRSMPDAQLHTVAAGLAKQIVANMDDTKVSTHSAAVNTDLTYPGTTVKQLDPCAFFDAKTFEQTLLARATQLQDYPKTAYPADVQRAYDLTAVRSLGHICKRESSPKAFPDNLSLKEALQQIQDAYKVSTLDASVEVDYQSDAATARHQVDVLSDAAAQPVSGLGDKATFGKAGLDGEINQLVVSKGQYVIIVQAHYGLPGSAEVPQADYVELGRALLAKLP